MRVIAVIVVIVVTVKTVVAMIVVTVVIVVYPGQGAIVCWMVLVTVLGPYQPMTVALQ